MYTIKRKNVNLKNTVHHDCENADYSIINHKLYSVDWSELFLMEDIESKVKFFNEVLSDIVINCIPLKRFFMSRYQEWFKQLRVIRINHLKK